MAGIADKSAELQELAVVGVDIDTVKSQLEEYKVSINMYPQYLHAVCLRL